MNTVRAKALANELANPLRRALRLRKEGRRGEAIALLRPLISRHGRVAHAAGILATLYWETGDYRNSAKWYARASALAPHSEHASLGLFHSLWDLGKMNEAFGEMRRFLRIAESREYSRLLKELNAEPVSQSHRRVPLARLNGSKSQHVKSRARPRAPVYL